MPKYTQEEWLLLSADEKKLYLKRVCRAARQNKSNDRESLLQEEEMDQVPDLSSQGNSFGTFNGIKW